MAKTIPMIITNSDILVKDRDTDDFKTFSLPGTPVVANIPFYHHYAAKISETQHYFKEFIKSMYGKKLSKNILAILVPDDTTALESIFINELFLNSDACKAVAQMKMGQALSKTDESYVSISKSGRNLVLLYVKNNEVIVSRYYDANGYDPAVVKADAARLHIDIEYKQVPVYVNNFNMNMDEFRTMQTLMLKVQKQAKAIKKIQEVTLPNLRQQLAETTGIFKGKDRKALEKQIQQTETELAEKLDKIPDILKDDGYPDVQAFMKTYRKAEAIVTQYNQDLAEWEQAVKNGRKPAEKQHRPPERQSVRNRLRQLQEEGKQNAQPKQRKKSQDRDR